MRRYNTQKVFPLCLVLLVSACVAPARAPDAAIKPPSQTGIASWYGASLQGQATANGETFDQNALTAAHRTFPMPSLVEVTNLENGRKVIVRVNDRGPFVKDRLIDLSRAAAQKLGFKDDGEARVEVTYLGPAPASGAKEHAGP